jgi:hypothetical protein
MKWDGIYWGAFGIIWIAFFMGVAVALVGKPSECAPNTNVALVELLALMLVPGICGYIAGRCTAKTKGE